MSENLRSSHISVCTAGSAYFQRTYQPLSRLIIASCRSVSLKNVAHRGSIGSVNRGNTYAHIYTQQKGGKWSNASVSISQDPQSGTKAMGVNGCAEKLWDSPSIPEHARWIHYPLSYTQIKKRDTERRWKTEMMFCLLKASGGVRTGTRVDWEQVVWWKRGPREGGEGRED